ncbi:hypothetical protein QYE76_047936 [Lolium multiflorum]|uniref:F-box domain-containing protein n=1 Tax=Lolium multiflorum TaxID=4521 RepID=A0AAD8TSH9_LOLMU|nr:hypothetical protein QYE76_047936 [Lolium multiflorum]
MGAVLSCIAVCLVLTATWNYARRWLMMAQDAAVSAADWADLPEDLLLIVMAALDIQSLARSGAVCTSWRDACSTFRIRELKQAPCLFYACEKYGSSDAALYCPSTDATFRVPFPGPPHDKRGFVFSCNGWVFAADEVGNPYIFNPMTGVQAALPRVQTINPGRDEELLANWWDDEGKHVWGPLDFTWARLAEYCRVAISTAAEVTACTVLIVHMPEWRLSYARPGDKGWTLLPDVKDSVSDILYNERDGLFYILIGDGSVFTLDLNGPKPSLTRILRPVQQYTSISMYLALTPSGELLQVWRIWSSYQDAVKDTFKGRIDFVAKDNTKEHTETMTNDQDIEVPLLVDNVNDEVNTTELVVFKVNIKKKKLVELRDIGDHALFLGFNASICVPTKDFFRFEPNCAYLTDDLEEHNEKLRNDRVVWNIKKRSMEKLDDVWACTHPYLPLPAPIWITPRF